MEYGTGRNAVQVVEAFQQARQKLFGSLDRLKIEAQLLGPASVGQRDAIEACKRAVSDDQAQCGVVGGEGVGKSTLINAILGEDSEIVPTEKHRPGTVAPTYIRYGSGPPRYRVTVDEGGRAVMLDNLDIDEFQKFALQKHNPNNEKLVRNLEVFVDNPLLAGGLTLVDIPGGEGVSIEVKEQTKRFLHARDHAVVGVSKERIGYGPLKRILGELPDPAEGIGALIYNATIDGLDGDGTVEQLIAEARDGFVENVAARSDPDTIAALKAKTFVAHLKYLANRRPPRNDMEQALALQGQAALRQIAKVIEERSVNSVLRRAVRRTVDSVGEFRAIVARRKAVIDKLLEGATGADEVKRTRDLLDLVRRDATRQWQGNENSDAAKADIQRNSAMVRSASADMLASIKTDLSQLQVAWRAREEHDTAALQSLANSIEQAFTTHALKMRDFWTTSFVEALSARIKFRQALVSDALKQIDLFNEVQDPGTDSKDTASVNSNLSLTVDRGNDVQAALGFASSMATLSAGMAATGIGGLVAIAPAALAAVSGVYAGVRHLIRGGDKGAGEKMLRKAFDEHLLALPDASAEAEHWLKALASAIGQQKAALDASFMEIENILANPEASKDQLKQLSEELSTSLRRIVREQGSIAELAPEK